MVSLSGYFKDSASLDDEGFIEFAKNLPRPEIYSYLKKTHRISDIRIHKIPSSRWRHYEKLKSFPKNLILLGDSVCAFNPIFAQGMTVAAKSASLLNKMLLAKDLKGISDRYRKALPAIIKVPWLITGVLDMKYSQTKGKRPLGYWFLSWYVSKLLELTSVSSTVYHEFSKLIHLKKGLWVILSPRVSARVLAYGIKSIFIPLEKRANTKEIPYDVSDCN
jgi:flavin-dependent dehydrogenase